jgi:hypothetical protein
LTKKIIAAALIALIALVSPAAVGEAKAEPRGHHRRGRGRGRGWGPRYESPDPGSAFFGGIIGGLLGGLLAPDDEDDEEEEVPPYRD